MKLVSYLAADAYLLNDQPTWTTPVGVNVELPTSYERGLSGRETRRPTGDTVRLSLKWDSRLVGLPAIVELRNSLQDYAVQPVLCPFWPGAFVASATPTATTAYYVLFLNNSYDSIRDAATLAADVIADPVLMSSYTCYPMIVGYLKNSPDPSLISDGFVSVQFEFSESDASSLTPPAFVPPNALADASGVRPLFPFQVDWSKNPSSGGSEQDVTRKQVGSLRSLQTQYYTQRSRRKMAAGLLLTDSSPINLIRFFMDLGGESKSFWMPGGISEASLTANVANGANAITVDNPSALGGNVYIALNNLVTINCLKVSGVAGSNWNLTAATTSAFLKSNTRVETLLLARFDTLSLDLSFISPKLARASINFKELPWEPVAVGGETIGVTMGALPPTAIFYKFTLTIPGGNELWYLTNFERDLSDGVNNWLSAPIESGDIIQTDNLERQSVDLTSRNFADNPLALLIPFQLEFPLLVEIYEGDVDGATSTVSNLRCYYAGEVEGADVEPPFITAQCSSMSSIFDRNIPRKLYQPGCNWVLFEGHADSTRCTLDPADWTWTAQVADNGTGHADYDPATSTIVIDTVASANLATLVAHFFASGYIQIITAGQKQLRMISDSLAIAGGKITVNLAQPLFNAPAIGDVVNILPGCDGKRTTCITKYNNYLNFGGFPFMPVGNPSVLRISQNQGGGKK